MSKDKTLFVNMTGEPYQPARLYYKVLQKDALLLRLKELKCFEYDPPRSRWVWLYSEETKNLKFKKCYKDIPKSLRSIVLGSITFKSEDEMILDVRSFERVIQAIIFFDKKISRSLAKIIKLRIVNKLFPVPKNLEEIQNHPKIFFEKNNIKKNKKSILSKVFSSLEILMNKPSPEVEEIETNFYEDGIEGLEMSLNVKYIVALEHWKGNKNITQLNIIQNIMKNGNNLV